MKPAFAILIFPTASFDKSMLKLISATFQCACVLALFLATPILRAQFETATLTGAISDPQGALIPKASVKLTKNEALRMPKFRS